MDTNMVMRYKYISKYYMAIYGMQMIDKWVFIYIYTDGTYNQQYDVYAEYPEICDLSTNWYPMDI